MRTGICGIVLDIQLVKRKFNGVFLAKAQCLTCSSSPMFITSFSAVAHHSFPLLRDLECYYEGGRSVPGRGSGNMLKGIYGGITHPTNF